MILLGAFPNATDAFSDASIVYYRFIKTFEKLFLTFYLAKYTVHISALQTLLFSATIIGMSLYDILKLIRR